MDALEGVIEAYERGRFTDAWAELGHLTSARATSRGRSVDARLHLHLGAETAWKKKIFAHYRTHPKDPCAVIDVGYWCLTDRGPLATWEFLERSQVTPLDDVSRAELIELEALALVELRDFLGARRALDAWKSTGLAPLDRATAEAQLLSKEDRVEDALRLAIDAAAGQPARRRHTMMIAELLTSVGRMPEAIALLREHGDAMQAPALTQMLLSLAFAAHDTRLCVEAADRLGRQLTLAEPKTLERVKRMRAEAAYQNGEVERAISLLEGADDELGRLLLDRLKKRPANARRIVLPVPFVRQEHLGCAPATLAAVSRFFERTIDHVELADRICYHGTPAHAERAWAESQGFVAREFRLAWGVAVSLLENGLPFIVSTFVPGAGHAQAVIGFDERRRSLLIRDPNTPLPLEVDADQFIERFRHSGPRCILLVPPELAERVQGVSLPDDALYDQLFEIERALHVHDRPRAAVALERLVASASDHRLARAGRRALAAYDDDPAAVLAVAEEGLALDATNDLLLFDVLATQEVLVSRASRLEALSRATKADAPPVFFELLATELASDVREHARVRRLTRAALERNPMSARAVDLLARIAWAQGDTTRAVALFRFAACLESTQDTFARQYLQAAHKTGRYDDALAFVRDRVDRRIGGRDAGPAVLLADALEEIGRTTEANAVLDAALKRREDDGELMLARCQRLAQAGALEDARALFVRAKPRISEARALRVHAELLRSEGASVEEQLAAWRTIAALDPRAVDAHLNVAQLLRRSDGVEASLAHLAACAQRVPHHRPTIRVYLEALREGAQADRIKALEELSANEPTDAWAQRELALAFAGQREEERARAALERAATLEPRSAALHVLRGILADERGDRPAARAAYLAAVTLEVDVPLAIARLIELTEANARRTTLDELLQRLEQSATNEDSFEAFYAIASAHVDASVLTTMLERLQRTRPALAVVWRLSVRHAIAVAPDRAATLANEMLARFSLDAAAHLEAAEAASVAGEGERSIALLERAVELAPNLTSAVARLVNALEARGAVAKVDALLDIVRRRTRFDPAVEIELVRTLARRDQWVDATKTLTTLLTREPEHDQAWTILQQLAHHGPEELELAMALATKLGSLRPKSDTVAAANAMLLFIAGRSTDAVRFLDEAAARGKKSFALRDVRAVVLAGAGRIDEALLTCDPEPGARSIPELGWRKAWVLERTGNIGGAIGCLQSVLTEHPSFVRGWQYLVDCWLEAGDSGSACQAATRLVAIAPLDASSHERLGRALAAGKAHDRAKVSFHRALERDPNALSAAGALFDVAMATNDVVAAATAVDLLTRRLPQAKRVWIDVDFALLKGEQKIALEHFRRGCADPETPGDVLAGANRTLAERGLGGPALEILDVALRRPESNPNVGALWMQGCFDGFAYETLVSRLLGFDPSSPPVRSAAAAFFDRLAAHPSAAFPFGDLFKLRTWLNRDDVAWSAPISALVTKRQYLLASIWGRSWKRRQNVPTQRLHILGVAFQALGLRRRALELMHHMVETAAPDEAATFQPWIAFERALRGETADAEQALARAELGPVLPVAQRVRDLARVIVAIEKAPPNERVRVYRELRASLELTLEQTKLVPSLRHHRKRLGRHLVWRLGRLSPLSKTHPLPLAWITIGSLAVMTSLRFPSGSLAQRCSLALAVLWPFFVMLYREIMAKL